MTQATGQTSFVDAEIEFGSAVDTYTDISGWANELNVSGGDRASGEVYTADGDEALLGFGKRAPLEIDIKIVYTEGTGDAYELIRAAYEAAGGTAAWIRWSPKGGDATEFQYTSTEGRVTKCSYPGGPVEPGDPLTIEFTVKVAAINKAVIAA